MVHAFLVHDQHDEINSLASELQPPTTSCQEDRGRCAPAISGSAGRHALSVMAANSEGKFNHRRNYNNALRIVQDFLWDTLVRRAHDFLQDICCCFKALRDFRIVLRGILSW